MERGDFILFHYKGHSLFNIILSSFTYGHKTTAPHTVMSVTRLFVSFIVSSHQLYQIVELDDSL